MMKLTSDGYLTFVQGIVSFWIDHYLLIDLKFMANFDNPIGMFNFCKQSLQINLASGTILSNTQYALINQAH